MQNNNKYRQDTAIVKKVVFEDKDGNTKYRYTVHVDKWSNEKKQYVIEHVNIVSTYEHDLKDEIKVQQHKSLAGEIYFTEVDPFELLKTKKETIEDNEELPFNV